MNFDPYKTKHPFFAPCKTLQWQPPSSKLRQLETDPGIMRGHSGGYKPAARSTKPHGSLENDPFSHPYFAPTKSLRIESKATDPMRAFQTPNTFRGHSGGYSAVKAPMSPHGPLVNDPFSHPFFRSTQNLPLSTAEAAPRRPENMPTTWKGHSGGYFPVKKPERQHGVLVNDPFSHPFFSPAKSIPITTRDGYSR